MSCIEKKNSSVETRIVEKSSRQRLPSARLAYTEDWVRTLWNQAVAASTVVVDFVDQIKPLVISYRRSAGDKSSEISPSMPDIKITLLDNVSQSRRLGASSSIPFLFLRCSTPFVHSSRQSLMPPKCSSSRNLASRCFHLIVTFSIERKKKRVQNFEQKFVRFERFDVTT